MLTWVGTVMIGSFLLSCTAVVVTSGVQILRSIRKVPIDGGFVSQTQEA
ncbi:hypothetical protein DEAC_c03640 [Desulfosporosinus acididurans]|uniref:Uncharacterized protein n=1 Tax=Desulfosporosinus acididurans TaxID=476652 RepID=A0A0J1ITH6_9FIRM|nr:hypothetical protein [Desulfosporosinus acididurans]KLU67956.1 hypothetical protein DEAC_c03640 [Desulfosporosinus acididurans]